MGFLCSSISLPSPKAPWMVLGEASPQTWESEGLTHQGRLSGFHYTPSPCPLFPNLVRDQPQVNSCLWAPGQPTAKAGKGLRLPGQGCTSPNPHHHVHLQGHLESLLPLSLGLRSWSAQCHSQNGGTRQQAFMGWVHPLQGSPGPKGCRARVPGLQPPGWWFHHPSSLATVSCVQLLCQPLPGAWL